jgi:RimJ/RimL family protein N-acetyltransferase
VPTPVSVAADGLLLRPWTSVDAEQVAEAARDPLIALWNPMTTASAEQWCTDRADWSDGTHASWAIVDPDEPAVVLGSVSVFSIDAGQLDAEAGFWVAAAHRRRGVGARALHAATTYAFDVLQLRRIVLYHGAENDGSCAVARANGYELEGVHRLSHRYGDGTWHDEHSHARLREQ